MCGIYGVFGSGILKQDLGVFHNLAFLNQLRGVHSTGVMRAFHDKHRKPEILKDTVPAMFFFNKQENRKILEEVSPVAIMGHNRSATVGDANNIAGAHPFETERYIGFHNGTLREDEFCKHPDYLTDSEALWNKLDGAESFEDTLAELYKDSAFALAYYEKATGRVGFVRNGHRPLAFAAHQKRNVVYYSSDIRDLEYAIDRFDVDAETYTLGTWQHISTDPRKLNFNTEKERVNLWNINKIEPCPKEKPVEPSVVSYYTGIPNYREFNSKWDECVVCNEPLEWARAGQSTKLNPTWYRAVGKLCHNCHDTAQRLGIDPNDQDCGAYIDGLMCEEVKQQVIIN